MEQSKGMIFKAVVWFMTAVIVFMMFLPLLSGVPFVMSIIWAAFLSLFLFLLHGVIYKKIKKRLALIADGLKGIATIQSITEHPEFQSQYNTQDIFTTILFSVQIQTRQPYTMEKKERINPILYKKFKVGATIPIRINQTDSNDIIFLLTEIKS